MSGRKVANLLALAVLAYLSRAPMHPYELSKTLRAHGDDRSIKFTHGSLYMVVAAAGEGRARRRAGDQPRGAAPRAHRLRHHPRRAGRAARLAAGPGRHAAARVPGVRLGAVAGQRPAPRRGGRAAAAAAGPAGRSSARPRPRPDRRPWPGPHPLFLIEEVYRQGLLDAEIAFVHRFIEQITDPVSGWGPMWAAFHDTE